MPGAAHEALHDLVRAREAAKKDRLRAKHRLGKKDVMEISHYGDESVSVPMEEIKSQDWLEKVYKPDIKSNWEKLCKKPGHNENDL